MCGIAGFWAKSAIEAETDAATRLSRMTDTILHRGPDDNGIWTDGLVGLGHTRLAIIDLTDAGAQPMVGADGDIHIAYNGETYNFNEIKAELAGLGHQFRSESDTEVLIAAYRQWGPDFLHRLRGMFAFAIWDEGKKRLMLARDRIGKKPLYYGWHQDRLYFASEIKAILAGSDMPRIADLSVINGYLTYQYTPEEDTAFKGIKKLRPGAFMLLGEDGIPNIESYWTPPPPTDSRKSMSRNDLESEIVERFDEAVKLRLVSDVPVGAFLSGGIDSASVVASMAMQSSGPVETFTMGFDEPAFDERQPASLVAEMYGTEHHEHVVKPDVVAILDKLVWHYGEPYADSSAVPSFCVSELASMHVKVAMNGDGGDETFLGYSRYAAMKLASLTDFLPAPIRRGTGSLADRLPFATSDVRLLRYFQRFLKEIGEPPAKRYGKWIAYFSDEDKQGLYADAMTPQLAQSSLDMLTPWFDHNAPIAARAAWADMHCYLPDDLLVKIDIATMAYGLEARSPFLDHDFIEFSSTIPAHLKLQGMTTKSILKKAMAERLPPELLTRPKQGFGVPIDRWFRNELKTMVYDILLSDRAIERGLFKRDAVEDLLDRHTSGQAANQYRIWALLMLELWFRMWIDPDTLPPRPTATAIRIL